MVFWSSSQIDEDGLRAKDLIARAMTEMGKPAADFMTVVQTGEVSDPVATIRTPHGLRTLKVLRVHLYEYSDEVNVRIIKRRLNAMYRCAAA